VLSLVWAAFPLAFARYGLAKQSEDKIDIQASKKAR
jgi:hypothetical protein